MLNNNTKHTYIRKNKSACNNHIRTENTTFTYLGSFQSWNYAFILVSQKNTRKVVWNIQISIYYDDENDGVALEY